MKKSFLLSLIILFLLPTNILACQDRPVICPITKNNMSNLKKIVDEYYLDNKIYPKNVEEIYNYLSKSSNNNLNELKNIYNKKGKVFFNLKVKLDISKTDNALKNNMKLNNVAYEVIFDNKTKKIIDYKIYGVCFKDELVSIKSSINSVLNTIESVIFFVPCHRKYKYYLNSTYPEFLRDSSENYFLYLSNN
ncbi:MAG: hypothetical protein U0457_02785 [Candidatus Sericytochromatia bacterium]